MTKTRKDVLARNKTQRFPHGAELNLHDSLVEPPDSHNLIGQSFGEQRIPDFLVKKGYGTQAKKEKEIPPEEQRFGRQFINEKNMQRTQKKGTSYASMGHLPFVVGQQPEKREYQYHGHDVIAIDANVDGKSAVKGQKKPPKPIKSMK